MGGKENTKSSISPIINMFVKTVTASHVWGRKATNFNTRSLI